ncbi:hypothetical protein BJ138DRAFT_1156644 [Hygrophoropsis aurantiaca]|uniref:Uncharacterized protein n=1 Tax=Hygrophoropsis aurantiaca TaxID=72124 RepID=A0ACB8A5S4_9AGAM|nr:hypothetical protein BJ138DRAFT_1156644 [Hygrophoropsis aurantiaca]
MYSKTIALSFLSRLVISCVNRNLILFFVASDLATISPSPSSASPRLVRATGTAHPSACTWNQLHAVVFYPQALGWVDGHY